MSELIYFVLKSIMWLLILALCSKKCSYVKVIYDNMIDFSNFLIFYTYCPSIARTLICDYSFFAISHIVKMAVLICDSAEAHSLNEIIAGRFLVGLGIGVNTVLVPIYISEVHVDSNYSFVHNYFLVLHLYLVDVTDLYSLHSTSYTKCM